MTDFDQKIAKSKARVVDKRFFKFYYILYIDFLTVHYL